MKFYKLFLIFFLIPCLCFGDSELTVSGRTAQAHLIKVSGVDMQPRPYLSITGDSVVGSDSNGQTVVTISGSGSGTVSTGVANRAAVYTAANTTVSASNVITDDGTNVGINTVNPQDNLSVGGKMAVGSDYSTRSAPTNGLIVQGNVGIGTAFGNAGLVVMNGNVGIGTWKPSGILDIANNFVVSSSGVMSIRGALNNISSSSNAQINLGSSGTSIVRNVADANPNLIINQSNSSSTGDIAEFQFNSVSKDVVNFNGNVGIGSTNPGVQLDVNGTIRVKSGQILVPDGTAALPSFAFSSAPSSGLSFSSNVIAANISGSNRLTVNGSGITVFGDAIPSLDNTRNLGTAANRWNALNVGTGTSSFGGNVGINSTNPGWNLDIQGTARMTGFNLSTGVNNNYVLTADASGNGTWKAASGSGANPGGSATQLQYQVNGTTFGGISGTAVDSNGNIGIGSVTPGQTLDVQGTIRNPLLNFVESISIGAQGGGQ